MLFVILSFILLNLSPALASTSAIDEVKNSLEVPFYKSTQSLFPSGAANIEKLQKELVKTEQGSDQYYKWNKLYFKQNEIRPIFATHLSQYVIDSKSNKRLKVIETNTKTLQVFNSELKTFYKKNISEVKPDAYDLGFVMSLKDIYLKTKPDAKSSTQTTIPQGTRLVVEKYTNDFALVKYQNYVGFANLSELITKFDFATFVYAGKNWHQIKSRQFDKIITTNDLTISLNDVIGMVTPEIKGIIASNTQKLPIWSQIEVVQDRITSWHQSKLKDHGLVWWKALKETDQIYYTIDDLLKKDISSVSFHPKDPLKGILSSNGVYITEDGYHWRKLQQFENFNGPVHYFNDLLIFVGNFRSTNGGKTFDNYIQIDKLASAIEYQYGFFPKKLQVKKIESEIPFKLKLEIETGIRKIKMESPLFAQSWTASKG